MPSDTLILGTAGHIDHGKTSLVRALTGTDTDRLPEEKSRGMTIDIGFAELKIGRQQFGVIDVPGHERFIRNMVAGAATIDMALIVVAADDSVMPQTREHVAILQLLGIEHAVIAITKSDLRDREWLELVQEDVKQLTGSTSLAGSPIVLTACPAHGSPHGIEELKRAISAVGHKIAARTTSGPFRLYVDRSFIVAGRGTVVTGTAASGVVRIGDPLHWLPADRKVTVRGLQNHGLNVEAIQAGQRAAVNITGASHHEIQRGDVLAAPGILRDSRWLSVSLTALPDIPVSLNHRGRYRLHMGTQVVNAQLFLYDANQLAAGEEGLAQLRCQEPTVAVWGQPFVLRSESPLATIAGGRVLQPTALPMRRTMKSLRRRLADLASGDLLARAAAAIYFLARRTWRPADLIREAGLLEDQLDATLDRLRSQGTLITPLVGLDSVPGVHTDVWEEWRQLALETVSQYHRTQPLQPWAPRSQISAELGRRLGQEAADALLQSLLSASQLVGDRLRLALPEFSPQLKPEWQSALTAIGVAYRRQAFQPPSPAELAMQLRLEVTLVTALIKLSVDRGELVHVAGDLFLDAEAEVEMQTRVRTALSTTDGTPASGMTVSQIRDLLDTSRKFAVPLCEYLDRIGLTRRHGDVRVLAMSEQ